MGTVVFDMDGTLVDSEELAIRASEDGLREYWARRGLAPIVPPRAVLRSLIGLPSIEYFAGLLPEERRTDAAELRTLVARREVERLAAGEGRLYPGAWDALVALRACGWRLALVSNCGRIYLDANLRFLRLGEIMDVALCLDHFPSKTENVRQAVARLGPVPATAGLPAEAPPARRAGRDAFMVGDRAADIEAGRANGLRTIGCTYGFGTRAELAAADRLIASPAELAEALA